MTRFNVWAHQLEFLLNWYPWIQTAPGILQPLYKIPFFRLELDIIYSSEICGREFEIR